MIPKLHSAVEGAYWGDRHLEDGEWITLKGDSYEKYTVGDYIEVYFSNSLRSTLTKIVEVSLPGPYLKVQGVYSREAVIQACTTQLAFSPPTPSTIASDITLAQLFNHTKQLSDHAGWKQKTNEKRLKYLAAEVVELAFASTPKEKAFEAFDVIWNALDFLRINGFTAEEVEGYFKEKFAADWARSWTPDPE